MTAWTLPTEGPIIADKIDETHAQLRAPYGQVGKIPITARVTCGSTEVDSLWELDVHALAFTAAATWKEGTSGPLAREYGACWLDEQDPDTFYIFGGFHYEPQQFTASNDIWSLNLVSGVWTEHTFDVAPPLLGGGRLVTIPGTRDGLFLGGMQQDRSIPPVFARVTYGAQQVKWADEKVAQGTVQPDYQPGLVYDSRRKRYLSLCGLNKDMGSHCDVRSYTPGTAGGTWEALAIGDGPRGRNGHYFAYDEETDRVILFGGDDRGLTLGDTWALELGETPVRWVKLGEDPAMDRRNGAFTLDPLHHRFLLWGGTPDGAKAAPDVWFLNLDRGHEAWTQVTIAGKPPDRASGIAVYEPTRRSILMGFGNSLKGNFADLWRLSL